MTAALAPTGHHEAAMQRRARVAALTRAGRSAEDIAAIEGITQRSVTRIRSDMGVSQPFTNDPLRPDELATAAELLEDGCSYNEVARTLGRSPSALRRRFPGYGWPPVECGRFAAARRRARSLTGYGRGLPL